MEIYTFSSRHRVVASVFEIQPVTSTRRTGLRECPCRVELISGRLHPRAYNVFEIETSGHNETIWACSTFDWKMNPNDSECFFTWSFNRRSSNNTGWSSSKNLATVSKKDAAPKLQCHFLVGSAGNLFTEASPRTCMLPPMTDSADVKRHSARGGHQRCGGLHLVKLRNRWWYARQRTVAEPLLRESVVDGASLPMARVMLGEVPQAQHSGLGSKRRKPFRKNGYGIKISEMSIVFCVANTKSHCSMWQGCGRKSIKNLWSGEWRPHRSARLHVKDDLLIGTLNKVCNDCGLRMNLNARNKTTRCVRSDFTLTLCGVCRCGRGVCLVCVRVWCVCVFVWVFVCCGTFKKVEKPYFGLKNASVCTFKTSPCVPAPRAHVLTCARFNMCAWCRRTRGRRGRTHGGFEWPPQHHDNAHNNDHQQHHSSPKFPHVRFSRDSEVHLNKHWILHIFSLRVGREQHVHHSLYLRETRWAECNERFARQYRCGNDCRRLSALVLNRFDIQSRRGHHVECHGYSCRLSALGNHIVSTPFQIVEDDEHKKHKKSSPHVSVHTLIFHETHYPLSPPGNPNTIQYLIPGRTTNVELLKQMKNWQRPSQDPWSHCLINSRETTKCQTNYYSGRQKDNSHTFILLPQQVTAIIDGHECDLLKKLKTCGK